MNNTRGKSKYLYKRSNENEQPNPLLHRPTSIKERILQEIKETITEQCNKAVQN